MSMGQLLFFGNLRRTNEKKILKILFFIVNRDPTRIAFPSILAVKVTKEISNRKKFN